MYAIIDCMHHYIFKIHIFQYIYFQQEIVKAEKYSICYLLLPIIIVLALTSYKDTNNSYVSIGFRPSGLSSSCLVRLCIPSASNKE